jgi:hypothetical protein
MLVDKLFIGGVWTASDVRGSNTTGTPVVSAVLAVTGEEISDTYTLTVSARAGSTGTITIAASVNNPFNGRVIPNVNFDDATVHDDVVPGVSIVFDNAGVNGDVAEIIVGSPYGTFDASGVGAGVPTAGVRHQVENTGTSDALNSVAQLLPQVIWVRMVNQVFEYASPFAENADEKTAGGGSDRVMPYVITISAVSGVGAAKVATISVDGVAMGAASLLDMTTGASVSGVGIKAISPGYPYRVLTGPLEGMEFALDAGVANADEANVLIFPSRYVQLAPDVAGVEGAYDVVAVPLTEVGEAAGVITPSGVAYYWTRFLVPQSSNNESNPYPSNIALSASQSTAAGWEA